jgi:hypothetical protein
MFKRTKSSATLRRFMESLPKKYPLYIHRVEVKPIPACFV